MFEVVAYGLGGGDEAAHAREGLAERPDDYVYVILEAEMVRDPRAPRAEDADAVGVVDEYAGPVLLRQLDDGGQIANVALHAEDAVHGDNDAAAVGGRSKDALQVVHVVMAETLHMA